MQKNYLVSDYKKNENFKKFIHFLFFQLLLLKEKFNLCFKNKNYISKGRIVRDSTFFLFKKVIYKMLKNQIKPKNSGVFMIASLKIIPLNKQH